MNRRYTKTINVLFIICLFFCSSITPVLGINLKYERVDLTNIPDSSSNSFSYNDVMNPNLGYEDKIYYDHYIESFYWRSPELYNHYLLGQNENQTIKFPDDSPLEKPDFENGTTWYVDDIPGEGPGNPLEDFTRIQNAIDAAEHGDTIYVYTGMYKEKITIPTSLIIKGEDKNNTIIDGKGAGVVLSIFLIDWVKIQGFTISNGSVGINIIETSYQNEVIGNIIQNIKEDGILLRDSTNITLLNNEFQSNGISIRGFRQSHWNSHIINNNKINEKPIRYYKNKKNINVPDITSQLICGNCSHITINNLSITNGSNGIQLGFSSHNIIKNNIIQNNKRHGLILYQSDNNEIINNHINDNTGYGLWLLDSLGNIIFENTITRNHDGECILQENSNRNELRNNTITNGLFTGIWVRGSLNNIIAENYVANNRYDGISLYLESHNNVVVNNIITNNSFDSIYLFKSSNNEIKANNIYDNNEGIILYGGSQNNLVEENIIWENRNGILLRRHTSNNVVQRNYCHHNEIDGIGLHDDSIKNLIQYNICDDNMKGIAIRDSNSNTVHQNNCERNHQGILLNGAFFSTINNNTIIHNGVGIYLHNSIFNAIVQNIINYNSHKGITLRQYSLGNTIKYNQIGPWNYQGIYIEKSCYNRIHHNNISKNNDDGIGLVQTIGNQIHFNNFIENTNFGLEGFLCYDNARYNYWDGHMLPYLKNDLLVGGIVTVHPCLRKPVNIHIKELIHN